MSPPLPDSMPRRAAPSRRVTSSLKGVEEHYGGIDFS